MALYGVIARDENKAGRHLESSAKLPYDHSAGCEPGRTCQGAVSLGSVEIVDDVNWPQQPLTRVGYLRLEGRWSCGSSVHARR